MTIVFLSSTSKDLSRYREAVYRAIEGLDGFHCIRMEDFGARDNTAEELCRQKIAECELVVCLVGLCFGSLAPDSDESYTILEYRAANTASIPRLVFVSAEEDESLRYYPGYYRESDEKWNNGYEDSRVDFALKTGYEDSRVDFALKTEQSKSLTEGF